MQPTEQDLRTHFADLTDEALLQTAETAAELTPLALDVLRSELASRRLTMSRVELSKADLPSRDHGLIVSIRRFRDLSEAIVARGALEASSIPCFLRNENTVRIDWQISNAIGGIRLDVLDSDVDAAEAVLLPMKVDAAADAESDSVCPHCGSRDIHRTHPWGRLAVASILSLGFSLSHRQKEWTCDTCDTHWTDTAAPD